MGSARALRHAALPPLGKHRRGNEVECAPSKAGLPSPVELVEDSNLLGPTDRTATRAPDLIDHTDSTEGQRDE